MKNKSKKSIKIIENATLNDCVLASFSYLIILLPFALFGDSDFVKMHLKAGKKICLIKIILLFIGLIVKFIFSANISKIMLIPIYVMICIFEIYSLIGVFLSNNKKCIL